MSPSDTTLWKKPSLFIPDDTLMWGQRGLLAHNGND
jgi:hypothetical protein